jgi:mono/diheme cytochrome c family protein
MWFVFDLLLSFLLTGVFVACNYTHIKDAVSSNNQAYGTIGSNEKLTMMNYEFISSRILGPRCTNCHGSSGNVNLETYESVIAHLGGIQKTVFQELSMPKRGALTSDETRLLWNWILLGAPRISAAPPPADPDPLVPTYESINKHIFQAACITCHSPTGSGKRILMDKESLMNSPLELIIPGNSDESGLVVSVERADNKRMPPPKEGYAVLKKEEKAAIRTWIDKGAKD